MSKLLKFTIFVYAALLLIAFTHHLHSQEKVQKIDELVQKYHELGEINGAVLVSEGGKEMLKKLEDKKK